MNLFVSVNETRLEDGGWGGGVREEGKREGETKPGATVKLRLAATTPKEEAGAAAFRRA